MNDVTRCIAAQAFNGVIRDIKFSSTVEKSLDEFLKSAKPILYETLGILLKENRPLKICTVLHFGRNESVVYAIRLDDYILNNVITRLINNVAENDMFRTYKPNALYLLMNTVEYDRDLERKYLLNQCIDSYSDSENDECVLY